MMDEFIRVGYVKIFRSFLDWEWFQKPEMVQLWLYLLLKANHREREWQGRTIRHGQLFAGRQKIQAETGLSEQTVRTCLRRLRETGEITTEPTRQGTLITIVKWDKFQDYDGYINLPPNHQANQQPTNSQPTGNQQLTTNKNVKNEKNEKNEKNIYKKTYRALVDEYTEDADLRAALDAFVEMRKAMKGFTVRALELALKKLDELAQDDRAKTAIVNQSVERSWKGFFPLKSTAAQRNDYQRTTSNPFLDLLERGVFDDE